MEIQKAVEWIRAISATQSNSLNKNSLADRKEALHMAVAALKKQMPKKVKNRKLLRDFYNRPYSMRGDCPNCRSEGLLSTNTDYCNACGQKLDWSENNGE